MDKIELVVYSRNGCHLCDALLEELAVFCSIHPYIFKTIEISGDKLLEKRYGTKVPVVTFNNTVLCEYFLDTDKIQSYFDKAGN